MYCYSVKTLNRRLKEHGLDFPYKKKYNSNMYKKIIIVIYLITVIYFSACKPEKPTLGEINYSIKTLNSEIPVRFPGMIYKLDSLIILGDPRSLSNAASVFSSTTGKLLGVIGKRGKGPGEVANPTLGGSVADNMIVISDRGKRKSLLFKLNNNIEDEIYDIKGEFFKSIEWPKDSRIKYIANIGSDKWLFYDPYSPQNFIMQHNNKYSRFGTLPIESNLNNLSNSLNGMVRYNPNKNILIQSLYDVPNITAYKYKSGEFGLAWKYNPGKLKYNINNDQNLKWSPDQEVGFMEIAFMKDFIVALRPPVKKRDFQGLDMTTIRNLYLFDYEGNLVNTIVPEDVIVRITGEIDSNNLYVISINEEFELKKYIFEL